MKLKGKLQLERELFRVMDDGLRWRPTNQISRDDEAPEPRMREQTMQATVAYRICIT